MISEKIIILKSISWRLIATITTIILAWVVSGDMTTGFTIGGFEFVFKLIIYYLHEKFWKSIEEN